MKPVDRISPSTEAVASGDTPRVDARDRLTQSSTGVNEVHPLDQPADFVAPQAMWPKEELTALLERHAKGKDSLRVQYQELAEFCRKALRPEVGESCPPVIRMALAVLLNHIEPGWENCSAVVRLWLGEKLSEPQPQSLTDKGARYCRHGLDTRLECGHCADERDAAGEEGKK